MAVVRVSNEDPVADKKPVRRHMDGATAQEQLLDAAEQLFYRDGIRAISVDAVVERAGVNKMSVYRQFSSKDDLVVAYLTRMDRASGSGSTQYRETSGSTGEGAGTEHD